MRNPGHGPSPYLKRRTSGAADSTGTGSSDDNLRPINQLVSSLVRGCNTFLNPACSRLRLGCFVDPADDEVLFARWQRGEGFSGTFASKRAHQVVRNLYLCAVKDSETHSYAITRLRACLLTDLCLDADEVLATADGKETHLEGLGVVDSCHDQYRPLRCQRLGDCGGDRNGTVVHAFRPVLQVRLETELLSRGRTTCHGCGPVVGCCACVRTSMPYSTRRSRSFALRRPRGCRWRRGGHRRPARRACASPPRSR
jgi:hypothetical protein